jgi:signal transduction histidine kinase
MERGELPGRGVAVRSHAAWIAAVAVLAFAAFHASSGGRHAAGAAVARAVWAACLLVSAVALRHTGRRATAALMLGAALVSVVALAVVSWAEYPGPTFAYLLCAPLFVAVLLPDGTGTVAASGVASVAAVVIVARLGGESGRASAEVAFRALAAAGFALLGCSVHARLVEEARAAADARARALAELAESELRRQRVEALAETGSRAARLAHDMSSPLAAVRANLEFLEDALRAAPDDAALAEVREALAETRTCAERLSADVAALRAAGQQAPGGPDVERPAGTPPGRDGE